MAPPKDIHTNLTQDTLRSLLDYDPATGIFRWSKNICRKKCLPGGIAGCSRSDNSWAVRIDGVLYRAHRLAWLYMTGRWPENEIDHKNRDRSDNRWCNLREATRSLNEINKLRINKHGFSGVDAIKDRFRSRVTINGKTKHLGMFDDPFSAHLDAMRVKKELYGDFVVPYVKGDTQCPV